MWKIDEQVSMNIDTNVVVINCGHNNQLGFDDVIILRCDDPEIRYFCCTNCYRLVFARMFEDARTITVKTK